MDKPITNFAIASFDCGRGNTMHIEFPNVVEADAHMNIGIALMPFMKDGYHFIKEDTPAIPPKAEGLNTVETNFVKYLYKIRKANRDNATLDYSFFSGPRQLKIRERVFIAGTIFPVLSLSYSGEAIHCASAKIVTKPISLNELRLLFGESFREYKAFALEYISIDNDAIKIFLPKYTEVGINYTSLLKDFWLYVE